MAIQWRFKVYTRGILQPKRRSNVDSNSASERFPVQFHFRPLARFVFQWFDELGVRQCGPYHERRNHEREHVLGFPIVPAELEFAQTAVKVLYRNLVEGAYDPALEQAPIPVNRAGVNVAAHPLLRGVVDYFVL